MALHLLLKGELNQQGGCMRVLNLSLALALFGLGACSSIGQKKNTEETASVNKVMTPQITHERVNRFIQDWPDTAKSAAHTMVAKYGLPQEITPTRLVWEDNRPFRSTIVHREEITHNFPFPHADVLEQVVKYRVPVGKSEKLQRFDGSLVYDRTKGELTSHCDREETNIIALNLADEVVRGLRNVDNARKEFARVAQEYRAGNAHNITNTLMFNPGSETGDADMSIREFPDVKGGIEAEEAKDVDEAQGTMESDNLEI